MADTRTKLQLTAAEIGGMTKWPGPMIEEFLSITRIIQELAEETGANEVEIAALALAVAALELEKLDKIEGQVTFPAGDPTCDVLLASVTEDSRILLTIASNDATLTSVQVVAVAGGFTIYPNTAPTADCLVNYLVMN